jgi:hypothetical protein
MNLCRPISVVAGTRPPSIYDILKDDETLDKTLTSFYLPRDTVKALHVTRYFVWQCVGMDCWIYIRVICCNPPDVNVLQSLCSRHSRKIK